MLLLWSSRGARRSDVGSDDGPAVSGHTQLGGAAPRGQAARTGRGQKRSRYGGGG